MTVVSTSQNTEALTLTVVSELAAPPTRVWQLWSDPRQLERWWGPPTWPATFERHDFIPGGASRYFMTGPDGERAWGWWRISALDGPRSLEIEEGFADDAGEPNLELPVARMRVDLVETAAGTTMTVTSQFASAKDMQLVMEMGMEEGMTEAMNQIDGILAGADSAR